MADRSSTSSSGTWRAVGEKSDSGEFKTPARGLTAAGGRADVFAALARADVQKGNLVSAETNYRLALAMTRDPALEAELAALVERRDADRKTKGPQVR
jgi:hypothetical protein